MGGIEAADVAPRVRKASCRDVPEFTYKVGAVVRLKSGGPAMTVTRVFRGHDDEDCVSATWFWYGPDGLNPTAIQEAQFPADALKLATP